MIGRMILLAVVLVAAALVASHFLAERPGDEVPSGGASLAGPVIEDESVGPVLAAAEGTVAASEPVAASQAASPPPAVAPAEPEETSLGTAALTAGIPGEGPLAVNEIKRWLDDPKNHVVLKPRLPKGLDAGESEIQGLEANPLTRAKIELGRQLFFDPRLSVDGTISCADCHDPDMGYAANTRLGIGVDGKTGTRNSPVAFNRILSGAQFWDGRAESLEEQAKGPIINPVEMASTHDVCLSTLDEVPGYRMQFERIFPDGVSFDNAVKAVAAFERVLVTGPAPWDYYVELRDFEDAFAADLEDLEMLKEDDPDLYDDYIRLQQAADAHPLSDSARRGGELFFSQKANCTACHVGVNFSDELYHNLGVGMDAAEPDLGRFVVTGKDEDRGAFKTPTVRNVAQTAPYMHDGSQETLEEVVDWYIQGGHPNEHLDPKIVPLELTDQEKADLVAFMMELTGELPPVERDRLPE